MLQILKQAYPYYNTKEKTPKNSLAIFVCVFLFLYLFRPFDVNETEHRYSYAIICFIHAANAGLIYFSFFFLLNKTVNPSEKEECWKVYYSIIVLAIVMLLIGLGSFFLRQLIYNNPNNLSWIYFIKETVNTFLVGSLIFGVFTLVDFYRLLKINQTNASGFDQEIKKNTIVAEENHMEEEKSITIIIENESFELNFNEFLFAKAEGNYTTFYFNKNNIISKQLKRSSIKNIEEQIGSDSTTLIRTHRAFLVNTKHIIKITGNAQGYQLSYKNIDFSVPVSRTMIPNFKQVMNVN